MKCVTVSRRGFSESSLSDFCNEMLLDPLPAYSESVLLAQRLHTRYFACIKKTEKTTEKWNIKVDIISGMMVVEFLHILIATYSMANFVGWSMPNSCCFHILYTNLEWSDDLAVIPYSSSFLLYLCMRTFLLLLSMVLASPCQDFLNMLRIIYRRLLILCTRT